MTNSSTRLLANEPNLETIRSIAPTSAFQWKLPEILVGTNGNAIESVRLEYLQAPPASMAFQFCTIQVNGLMSAGAMEARWVMVELKLRTLTLREFEQAINATASCRPDSAVIQIRAQEELPLLCWVFEDGHPKVKIIASNAQFGRGARFACTR
jgi:hypothetical protein